MIINNNNNNNNNNNKKNHFTMEKADKHYLSKMIRSIPRLINHVDNIYPLYNKNGIISLYIIHKNSSIMR